MVEPFCAERPGRPNTFPNSLRPVRHYDNPATPAGQAKEKRKSAGHRRAPVAIRPLMGMLVRVPAQRFHPLEDRFGSLGRRRVEGR